MRFPIRYRMVVLILLSLAPVVAISSLVLVRSSNNLLWREAEKDGVSFADTVLSATRHSMLRVDREGLEAILDAVSRQKGVLAARLYDGQGRFRAPKSQPAPDLDLSGPGCVSCHEDPRRLRLPTRPCAHRSDERMRLFLRVPNQPECTGAGCHAGAEPVLGILEVGLDLSAPLARSRKLALWSGLGGFLVLGVALVPLLLSFRWALARPLAECLRLVRRVAAGDLAVRSRLVRTDEWGELLDAFDSMTTALADARGRLQVLNRGLERQVAARTHELKAALEMAKESDRMKMEFLTGISHEFTNPLQGAIGYAELLMDGIDGDLHPAQRHDVEVVLKNCRFLLELVEDLLELARLGGAGQFSVPDVVRLEDVARSVAEASERLTEGKPVEVALEVEPDCPSVFVDALALHHLIFHLVEYIVRHMEVGRVAVEVHRAGEGWVEVAVSNVAVGFETETLRSALSGYSPRGGGGGLGVRIALSRRLVELHGGSLSVEGLPGGGNRVRVRLPVSKEAMLPSPPFSHGPTST